MPTSRDRSRNVRTSFGDWKCQSCLVVHSGVAVATLAAGIGCLWIHAARSFPDRILAPAGMVLIACAAAQLRLLWSGWQTGRLSGGEIPLASGSFWQMLAAGLFVTYLAALAIGPVSSIGCAWGAAAATWYTVLLLPLATTSGVLEGWRKWSQERRPRRLVWLVYASLLLLTATEGMLQTVSLVARPGAPSDADFAAHRAATHASSSAPNLDALDALDLQMTELRDGRFRVAIVGDALTLRGARQRGCLSRIQQSLPGVDFVSLTMEHGWSTSLEADFPQQLTECRPDLVLAVVSACDEMARPEVKRSWFDWRGFALARMIGASPSTTEQGAGDDLARGNPTAEPQDHEGFLNVLAPQLQACRTPVEPLVQARWQRMFASLDALALTCADQRLPVAVVVVPGQFQVSPELLATLARRSGYSPAQIDIELPQRRLAGYAARRELPLVDLLPYLRMTHERVYEPNATHFSEEGNAVAASAIGGWLQSRYGGQLALAAQLSIAP